MIIVEPIVIAYHLSVEGDDPRMSLITSLFLWWTLAFIGSIANFRKWKHLGIPGRFGTVILAFMAVGFIPVIFFLLQELGPAVLEI